MIFVRTEDSNNVALSAVRSYAYTKSGKVRFVDDNQEAHLVAADDFDLALHSAIQSAIPAQPGTFFLTSVTHENGEKTWDQDAVIAWGIKADGGVIAIGTDGADIDNRAILMPSGSVTAAFATWSTMEEFLANHKD